MGEGDTEEDGFELGAVEAMQDPIELNHSVNVPVASWHLAHLDRGLPVPRLSHRPIVWRRREALPRRGTVKVTIYCYTTRSIAFASADHCGCGVVEGEAGAGHSAAEDRLAGACQAGVEASRPSEGIQVAVEGRAEAASQPLGASDGDDWVLALVEGV